MANRRAERQAFFKQLEARPFATLLLALLFGFGALALVLDWTGHSSWRSEADWKFRAYSAALGLLVMAAFFGRAGFRGWRARRR